MMAAAVLVMNAVVGCPAGSDVGYVEFPSASVTQLVPGSTPLGPDAGFDWIDDGALSVDLRMGRVKPSVQNCLSWYRLGDSQNVPANSNINVHPRGPVVDVYAFIYHEPPRSRPVNGDLPAEMLAAGWEPGSCAPTFATDTSGDCRMTAFRYQSTTPDTDIRIPFGDKRANYLVLAVGPGVVCSRLTGDGEAACEAPSPGASKACRWRGGECVSYWCPGKHVPPPPQPGLATGSPVGAPVAVPGPLFCSAPLTDPAPTGSPTTSSPTGSPTTSSPTSGPSRSPSRSPTTLSPSRSPTTSSPSRSPTTSSPSRSPTRGPTEYPTPPPTPVPTGPCVPVRIGCNQAGCESGVRGSGAKTVTVSETFVACDNPVTKNNRLNTDFSNANDVFRITLSGNLVSARRTDVPGNGWLMNLSICCFKAV